MVDRKWEPIADNRANNMRKDIWISRYNRKLFYQVKYSKVHEKKTFQNE